MEIWKHVGILWSDEFVVFVVGCAAKLQPISMTYQYYLILFCLCVMVCWLIFEWNGILETVKSVMFILLQLNRSHTHTHLTALFPGLPGWAGTRKVKPIWILLKRETVSGSDISWALCKFAPSSRQITTPAPHHSSFFTGRMPFLPPNQQRQSTEGKLNRSSCVITVLIVFMLCSSIPWSKTVLSHFCCSCFYGLYEMQ